MAFRSGVVPRQPTPHHGARRQTERAPARDGFNRGHPVGTTGAGDRTGGGGGVQGCWLTGPVPVSVRDATPEDASGVAALLEELGYPSSITETVGHIERFTRDSASRLQVAVDGAEAEVVGLVALHLVPRLDQDAYSCRITDIVVAERHRRAGVGTALLAAAEDAARAAGAPRLDLSSGAWRAAAHAFYEHHGFESRAAAFTRRF